MYILLSPGSPHDCYAAGSLTYAGLPEVEPSLFTVSSSGCSSSLFHG